MSDTKTPENRPTVSIIYGDSVTNLFQEQTATIKCADKIMKNNIVISSSGSDTSDATATSSDILKSKTAYAKSEKIVGTIETYEGKIVSDQYEVLLNSTDEVVLNTEKKYCEKNIVINPILEKKTVNVNGIYTPSEGYAGIGQITVSMPSDGYPQLYPPIISLQGDILTIEDNPKNGAFTTSYDIYVGEELIANIPIEGD